MLEACKSRRTEIVKLLLERSNSEESGLNTKNEAGTTVFMFACFYGPKDIVQLLLDHQDQNLKLNARNLRCLEIFSVIIISSSNV